MTPVLRVPQADGVRWSNEQGGPKRFEVPEDGAPFEGFRWRSVPELNVNCRWLYVYTAKPAGHHIKVSFDDVVVATDYIGPLRNPSGLEQEPGDRRSSD